MRFLFWNIRGFERPAMRRQIKDYIKEEFLDGVGLQETMKEDFTQRELEAILGEFKWVWKGVRGHSGGILMGIKEGSYELEDSDIGNFYVSIVVRQRTTNYRWELVTVYGPAQQDKPRDFIVELSRKCMVATLPLVFGGDFNLIRDSSEKNSSNLNQALMNKFNMFIDLHQLQKLKRSGSKFTCTNKQINPIMVTLDRILVSIEWETKYPLCSTWSRPRVGSDH
jgi:exonuclease III